MVDLGKNVGMGVQMQETDGFAVRDLSASDGLNDATGDRVISSDRNWPGAAGINSRKELCNPRDAILVVIGTRERDITNIDNFCNGPWVQTKVCMDAAGNCGDIAQRARAKMLVSLGGPISSGMRDADQGNIRPSGPVFGQWNRVGIPHQ